MFNVRQRCWASEQGGGGGEQSFRESRVGDTHARRHRRHHHTRLRCDDWLHSDGWNSETERVFREAVFREEELTVAARATRKHCLRMKVSVAGAASGIMGVAAGGGGAIGIGGHRDDGGRIL